MALSAWTESGADLFPLGTKPLLELSPNGLAYAGQWRDNGSRDKCFDIASCSGGATRGPRLKSAAGM